VELEDEALPVFFWGGGDDAGFIYLFIIYLFIRGGGNAGFV
jgi:hypothetical protein